MIDISVAGPQDFGPVYTLLEASFPPDEYRPRQAQQALLAQRNYRAYTVKDPNSGALQGVLTLWQLDGFAFIEHFAVDATLRNRGLGAQILNQVLSGLDCPVCLEAEVPETELAQRRIGFYQRNGFHVNSYPYLQPSYGPGRKPLPMVLLSAGRALSAEEFDRVKKAIYREVYRQN